MINKKLENVFEQELCEIEEDSRYCHNDSDDYHDCLDYMECEECPYYYADLD